MGVLLESNTAAGDRRRRQDAMIDGGARVREAEEDDEDDVEELGDPGSGSRGTCCGGRRRPGDAGYAGLELSSAGHGDGDGRGVGSLPRRREEAEEGKTERGGNPRVGEGLYRRKGAAPAFKSTGLPTWRLWMSCRTGRRR